MVLCWAGRLGGESGRLQREMVGGGQSKGGRKGEGGPGKDQGRTREAGSKGGRQGGIGKGEGRVAGRQTGRGLQQPGGVSHSGTVR
eukprot:1285674-Rhodomonas_salina.1